MGNITKITIDEGTHFRVEKICLMQDQAQLNEVVMKAKASHRKVAVEMDIEKKEISKIIIRSKPKKKYLLVNTFFSSEKSSMEYKRSILLEAKSKVADLNIDNLINYKNVRVILNPEMLIQASNKYRF